MHEHLGAVNAAKVAALDLGPGSYDSNIQLGVLLSHGTSSNGSGKDNNHQTTNGNKSKIEREKTAVAIEKGSSSSTKASTTTTKI